LTGNGLSVESLRFRDEANGGLPWIDGNGRQRNDGVLVPGVIRETLQDGTIMYRPNDRVVAANTYHSRHINDHRNAWSPSMVQDNNFVKLRDISLSYSFPRSVTGNLRMERLTLALQARNLFFLYKSINHIHPEDMLGTSINNQWIENSTFPMSRFFGFQVNVAF